MFFEREKVDSFECFSLKISAMRSAFLYEAVCEGQEVSITVSNPYVSEDEEGYSIAKFKQETGSFIDLLNECNLMDWDSFQGKHPYGVKDGVMFSMSAVVNEGRRIRASGSENFPKGYHELEKALYQMMRDSQNPDINH